MRITTPRAVAAAVAALALAAGGATAVAATSGGGSTAAAGSTAPAAAAPAATPAATTPAPDDCPGMGGQAPDASGRHGHHHGALAGRRLLSRHGAGAGTEPRAGTARSTLTPPTRSDYASRTRIARIAHIRRTQRSPAVRRHTDRGTP